LAASFISNPRCEVAYLPKAAAPAGECRGSFWGRSRHERVAPLTFVRSSPRRKRLRNSAIDNPPDSYFDHTAIVVVMVVAIF
jgi:hypothetical protein